MGSTSQSCVKALVTKMYPKTPLITQPMRGHSKKIGNSQQQSVALVGSSMRGSKNQAPLGVSLPGGQQGDLGGV